MRATAGLVNWFKGITVFRLGIVCAVLAALLAVAVVAPALTAGGRRRPTPTGATAAAPAGPASHVNSAAQNASAGFRTEQELKKFAELHSQASARGSVRVIVGLRSEFTPEGGPEDALEASQRDKIRVKRDALLQRLEAFAPKNVKRFRSIPYLAMSVNAEALESLKADPEVESIREDKLNRPSLAHSTEVADAPAAWRLGFSGQGQVIAILDSGVDKNHPFLSGKVIAEACFSTHDPESGIYSVCAGNVEESTAANSGMPCALDTPSDTEDECGHGTHVAGIAAGRSPSGNVQGVAKDATLVAIQVNTRFNKADDCLDAEDAPCVRTYDSDYMLGLEHVLALRLGGMNIASANLSLGEGGYTEKCDEEYPDIKRLIDNLQSAGVATVVASGNHGFHNAISSPACISSAISVGAVGDGSAEDVGKPVAAAEKIWESSNRSSFLNLLAPGLWIYSSSLNGGYITSEGTSMAAPHVAGAWAVIKQLAPNASVAQVLAALRVSGKPVDAESENGLGVPSIKIGAALHALQSCSYSLSGPGWIAPSVGDVGAFGVAAPAGCPWTASSNADWVFTDSSGSGGGSVLFTVAPNTGETRTGAITVGGQVFIIIQLAGGGDATGHFKITAPDGLEGDFLGRSVAVSGDTAVVGAPGDNIGANLNRGSAYVYVRNFNGTWSPEAKLFALDGGPGDEFGWSVAIEGDTVVVGARSHAVGSRVNQGAAYVFVRSGTNWTQQAKLVSEPDASIGVVDDKFGESVAIFGDRIVVGAPGFETHVISGLLHVGAVHIFQRAGTVWTRQAQHLQGRLFEKIGHSVSTANFIFQGSLVRVIAVGVPDYVFAGGRFGSVEFHVFDAATGLWLQKARITAGDRAEGDRFGESVAVAADGTAIVGAPSADIGMVQDQGAAYILLPALGSDGLTWALQTKLVAGDGAHADRFGSSVGICDHAVVVGAPHDELNGNQKQGSAYIFERAVSGWTLKRKLLADDGGSADEFGTSVGLTDSTAVVGAPTPTGFGRGSTHIFSPLTPPASTVQFGAATYSVNESARKVVVTVQRTGDTMTSAAVDFATANGTADRRSDYTQTSGELIFAAGETSKAITVFVTDDLFQESPEDFTVTLSQAFGTGLGATSRTTVTINSNDSSSGPSPVDRASFNPEFFVRQHYVDFLNREPDADGLAFWVSNFTDCGGNPACLEAKRINVSAAFFLSTEFQETGYLVYRIYKAAYGDARSAGIPGTVPAVRLDEFLPDSRSMGEGVQVGIGTWRQQLEINKTFYSFAFVHRPRFLDAFPVTMTPTLFVDKLNLNAGGVLSPFERDQLIAELSANNTMMGRASVLRKLAEDPDLNVRELRRAFVLMQYYGYMRRNPDDPQDTDFAGWKFWVDKLNQFNGDYVGAEMVKAFITSGEYKNRFGR